ncbi:MAG: type II toxin-antitoxin system Phd/YefM family antitoxin [Candidatus Rokubacteria bacterium]|nr:type II toxin-antitoxin system Phd/YefM family antitoxin [Candidatus Rokubacteria bacterium]
MTRSQKAGAPRKGFSGAISRVASPGDRIVIQQRGKPMAALVSLNDLRMLETLEDQIDVEAARKALADPKNRKRIPWRRVKATLGL